MASSNTAMCADPMNCPVQLTLVCPPTRHAYQERQCHVMQSHDHTARVLYKDPGY
jgi:hypothetical protein